MDKEYIGATIKIYFKSGAAVSHVINFEERLNETEYDTFTDFLEKFFIEKDLNMCLTFNKVKIIIPEKANVESFEIHPNLSWESS